MQLPSESSHRYFMVPSCWETCFRATLGTVRIHSAASWSRRVLGRLVISSKERAPLWSQVNTCLPRKAGWPMDLSTSVISCRDRDFKSIIKSAFQACRFMRQI